MQFKPGSLVQVRNREWVVLPSPDPDVMLLRPLGGSELETTGIYLPLQLEHDRPRTVEFPLPSVDDIGDPTSARLLLDAARLSFRTGAGPFRSFGKLSFRPRAYQLVPLIMALRLDTVRLLIADDVGIGKTIEALLIVREMLDRGLIERFAVICPPNLCDQWQKELQEKFSIEAEVIRSDTAARLDRDIRGDESVYRYYRFQVISIDYVKSDARRQVFLAECPELVIVDEAHTCARPRGAQKSQQQRHHLISDLAGKTGQHLMMLTATPHSGIEESFQSLLGMLRPEFERVLVAEAEEGTRRQVAKHFVQRRRGDIVHWIEETTFPKRDAADLEYELAPEYQALFYDLLRFTREFVRDSQSTAYRQRVRYWTALALLRGVISSPAAGARMLRNRAGRMEDALEIDDEFAGEILFDRETSQVDYEPGQFAEASDIRQKEMNELHRYADALEELGTLEADFKAKAALSQVLSWLDKGFQPIVFCRFIQTANYLADLIRPEIAGRYPDAVVEAVTSELNDDQRRERVLEMADSPRRVLVATDCLSEGINLQEHFTAVMHYDLPWNPNRIEQREGRVDRFGQESPVVSTAMMIGKNNPIDGVVLRVLLTKATEIRKNTGISVPFPENSESVMDAVLNAVLLSPGAVFSPSGQLTLGLESDTVRRKESEVAAAYDRAIERERKTRSIFAQHALKPNEIEPELRETDQALGDPATVEHFVREAMTLLAVQMDRAKQAHCYRLYPQNLPAALRELLPHGNPVRITFISPVPEGYHYLGRNHPFIEQLCQEMLRLGFDPRERVRPSRASVIRTDAVSKTTTLLLLRVRNVISDRRNEIVAEEMMVWGYRASGEEGDWLDPVAARELFFSVQPAANVSPEEQAHWLNTKRDEVAGLDDRFQDLTRQRTAALIDAHERYRRAIGGSSYKSVEPVLPPDVMGIYVLLPAGGMLEPRNHTLAPR